MHTTFNKFKNIWYSHKRWKWKYW